MSPTKWMISVFALVLIAGSAVSVAAQGSPSESTQSNSSTADVFWFPGTPNEGEVIEGAYSTIATSPAGVSATFHTSGLEPGSAVTLWWVFFNNPELCTHPEGPFRCGINDLLFFGGDEAVDGTMVYGAGQIVGADGTVDLGAFVAPGDRSGVAVGLGSGVVDPLKADVHLVIRTHGPADADQALLVDQLTTFGGGCNNMPADSGTPGSFECYDIQASVHEQYAR